MTAPSIAWLYLSGVSAPPNAGIITIPRLAFPAQDMTWLSLVLKGIKSKMQPRSKSATEEKN